MFKNFFHKYYSIVRQIPFLKQAVAIEATKEIAESIIVAKNPLTPSQLKFWAMTKGGCSFVSLVTAYGSQKIPEPRIATAFYICCLVSTVGYKYSGGNTVTALGLIALANKTST